MSHDFQYDPGLLVEHITFRMTLDLMYNTEPQIRISIVFSNCYFSNVYDVMK